MDPPLPRGSQPHSYVGGSSYAHTPHAHVQSTGDHFRDYPRPLDFHGSHGFNSGAPPRGYLTQSSVGYPRPRVGGDSSYAHSQHAHVQSTGGHFTDYPRPLDFHGSHGFNRGVPPPGHLAQSSVGYLRPRVGADSSYAHSQAFVPSKRPRIGQGENSNLSFFQEQHGYMAPPQLPGPRGGNLVRAAQRSATHRHARALNTVQGSNTPADIVAPAQAPVPGNAPVEKTIMGTCFNDWADEKGFKVQHNQGTYSFSISPRFGVEDENGVMVCKLPGVGGHEEKMSAKYFEEKELIGGMQKSRLYYFVPTASFRRGEAIIGVGNFLGKTVKEWIAEQEEEHNLWKLDSKGEIMAVGRIFGGVIRKVAKALTCRHKTHKSLGLSCRKMYITEMNFKLLEPPSTSNRSDDFEGVVNDLKEFQILVNLAAGPKHDKDTALQLFNSLFPTDAEYRDHNIGTLKSTSFVICHFPLFYSFKERVKFANAYALIRKVYSREFDKLITLTNQIYDVGKWWEAIPTTAAHPVRKVYDHNRPYGMKQKHLVLSFIRHLYHHYSEQANPLHIDILDEDLLEMFPLAFSKTYGQIHLSRGLLENIKPESLTLSTFVDFLKREGLDYSMDLVEM